MTTLPRRTFTTLSKYATAEKRFGIESRLDAVPAGNRYIFLRQSVNFRNWWLSRTSRDLESDIVKVYFLQVKGEPRVIPL
jgi:hypothetical protein